MWQDGGLEPSGTGHTCVRERGRGREGGKEGGRRERERMKNIE